MDPDVIGEAQGGIRQIAPKDTRPDDVPLQQNYRVAMHKLHNVVLVLENADRSNERVQSPSTEKLRAKMVDIQSRAKILAKAYKSSMRNLTSNADVAGLQLTYSNGMDALVIEITNHTREGEDVINKHNYLNGSTLKNKGTGLWCTRWLKTKRAVDSALTSLWGTWKGMLKTIAKSNKGDNSTDQQWDSRVGREKWKIFYGGSLMKGYKGPPKQNTRFLASYFDVDANMDAPAIAEYLIKKREKS
ncbi:MAG: hypothetical protein GKS05_09575 [Nitrospirales bacterium]|nr:hypothetical protein [Nitrospirales bacterium]